MRILNRLQLNLALIWLILMIGFLLLRSSTVLVWDDSPRLTNNLYDSHEPLVWSGPATLKQIAVDAFSHVAASGYRPLSHGLHLLGVAYFSRPEANPSWWFAAVGAIIGLLGVCAFTVSRRFLENESSALFAVFLFLFSTPFITGSWIVFAGIQALVPLIICGGLLLYWKVTETSQCKKFYVAGLLILLLFGPWFREFIGIVSLLVLFLEAQRHRRPTALMGLAVLSLLHAVFPTALLKWTLFPDLPLQPVFSIGLLGDQLMGAAGAASESFLTRMRRGIRWEVPLHFLSLYPPLLLFTVSLALFVPTAIVLRQIAKHPSESLFQRLSRPGQNLLSLVFITGVLIFSVYWIVERERGFILWLCVGVALLGWGRNPFLACWYLLSFIPFLWVFTEQVHLAYAMLPASIIVVAALENLWEFLKYRGFIVRAVFVTVVLWAAADHLLNLYGSYKVVSAINAGILTNAAWFKSHVPRDSLVVTNALHPEDIRLFSGGHIEVFWTVQAGIAHSSKAVDKPEALEALLRANHGGRDVYFLDVDYEYPRGKGQYHAHKYVWDESVEYQEIGQIHTTRAYYSYLDPFKIFVSRPYVSFLGAPDLENDFYRGPARDGTPFMREVYANYKLYRVTGTSVHPWDSNGLVRLHHESYRGFNILIINDRLFAIPQGEGGFDLQMFRTGKYSMGFVADGHADILRKIDEAMDSLRVDGSDPQSCDSRPRRSRAPLLIQEAFLGYSIFAYGSAVFATPQGEGEFVIERIERNGYSSWFRACSLSALKRQIAQ